MLLNTVQVLTSAFLVFAGTYFIYCALKNKTDWSGLISNLACAGSVSYTHLDVYKRQYLHNVGIELR